MENRPFKSRYDRTIRSAPQKKSVLTRRKEVEGVGGLLALVVLDDNGVTGIVTTGAAGADVCVRREDIDEFALTLVAPLGAEAVSVSTSTKTC